MCAFVHYTDVRFGIDFGCTYLTCMCLVYVRVNQSTEHLPLFVGVLVVLGLGTAVRLILECCHQRIMQRNLRRLELQPISSAYDAPLQVVTQSSDVQVKFLSTSRSPPRDDICERLCTTKMFEPLLDQYIGECLASIQKHEWWFWRTYLQVSKL